MYRATVSPVIFSRSDSIKGVLTRYAQAVRAHCQPWVYEIYHSQAFMEISRLEMGTNRTEALLQLHEISRVLFLDCTDLRAEVAFEIANLAKVFATVAGIESN